MKKIILITCYFGEFPWYFNLFLKSCEWNWTIDFLIFSDCDHSKFNLPQNVKYLPFTIQKFNKLASNKLNIDIDVKNAYKLCDFKPAYGLIFSEYIINYTFWGMTDIDIIFGRIREFLTPELLKLYDIISVRNDYPTGSFMLYRNTEYFNNLFKKSKDFKKIFLSDRHFCFDECNFKHDFLQMGGNIENINCEIDSMHHVIKREQSDDKIRVHFDFLIIEGLPGSLKWKDGILTFKNEFEVLMHHLILYKQNRLTRKNKIKIVPNKFYIDKYLIRFKEVNLVKGFILFLIYNKIIPLYFQSTFKLDFSLSIIFNMKMSQMSKSIYEYGNSKMEVSENEENFNFITFNDFGTKYSIIKSVFFKKEFYIYPFPYSRYKVNKTGKEILSVSLDGTQNLFQRKLVE